MMNDGAETFLLNVDLLKISLFSEEDAKVNRKEGFTKLGLR